MKRLLNSFVAIAVLALLPGCAVTLHGNQTTSGGSTAATTGSSVQAGKQFGNARVGGSFGAPRPAHAAGGQVSFSQSASAVLVVALVIAGTVDAISDWMRPVAPRAERLPTENISQTCSCYAVSPDAISVSPTQ